MRRPERAGRIAKRSASAAVLRFADAARSARWTPATLVVLGLACRSPPTDEPRIDAAPGSETTSEAVPAAAPPPAASPTLVSFPTADGGVVFADLWDGGSHGPHAVVLAHGGRFDKSSWREQAPVLRASGLTVLAIDFRGRGQSRGGTPSENRYDELFHDVLAAVGFLRERGADEVSVVGGSLGGWAAAEAAARAGEDEAIDRLVLLAASPVEEPALLPPRTLFVCARGDRYADGATRLTDVRAQHGAAPEPKQLLVVDGAAHAQHLFGTDQAQRVMDAILRWLEAP